MTAMESHFVFLFICFFVCVLHLQNIQVKRYTQPHTHTHYPHTQAGFSPEALSFFSLAQGAERISSPTLPARTSELPAWASELDQHGLPPHPPHLPSLSCVCVCHIHKQTQHTHTHTLSLFLFSVTLSLILSLSLSPTSQ